jgi:DNA topoisomerase I
MGTPEGPRAGDRRVLLVVESPAKARTLKACLGRAYDVRATLGHLKDLPAAREGIDVANDFTPTYEVLKGKNRVLSELKRAARTAERVLLATDPDREGEAIAVHIAGEIGAEDGDERVRRALIHELTPQAVLRAIADAGPLDRHRYDAQQARRILDRLVGFRMSGLLAKQVRRGLSAGRVQSVAVRLLAQREREVRAFVGEEYWTLDAVLAGAGPAELEVRLVRLDGRPATLRDRAGTEALLADLGEARFVVDRLERKERRRHPPAPFTTATLQQEAARRLGFSPRRTMMLAQRLFEGVELGDEGPVGLITYLRTDSVRLSTEAIDAARAFVAEHYGPDELPETPNLYAGRARAQQAHESIRPTSLAWPPDRVRSALRDPSQRDLVRLYQLIFSRLVACQMRPAVYEEAEVAVAAGRAEFRVQGLTLRRPGYLAAWATRPPDDEAGAEPPPPDARRAGWTERAIPSLEVGEALSLVRLVPGQRFTEPPPRFDEASLVKELEARGVGRPSTYASILEAIQEKRYAERLEGSLRPTELGLSVTDWLVRGFPRELDVDFTARLEEELDAVEDGSASSRDVLRRFWVGFERELEKAGQGGSAAGEPAASGPVCDRCGTHPLVVRWGRHGEFLACSGYPVCRNTMSFRREGDTIVPIRDEALATEERCPKCEAPMAVRRGRFGRFLACTRYPACDGKRAVPIGVDCPKCGGALTERRSARGTTFYGCANWSREGGCDFVAWDRPRDEACPECGSAWLVERRSRRGGMEVACPNKGCGFHRPLSGPGPAETPTSA